MVFTEGSVIWCTVRFAIGFCTKNTSNGLTKKLLVVWISFVVLTFQEKGFDFQLSKLSIWNIGLIGSLSLNVIFMFGCLICLGYDMSSHLDLVYAFFYFDGVSVFSLTCTEENLFLSSVIFLIIIRYQKKCLLYFTWMCLGEGDPKM